MSRCRLYHFHIIVSHCVTSGTAGSSNAHVSGITKLKFIAIAILFHGSAVTPPNPIKVPTNANCY